MTHRSFIQSTNAVPVIAVIALAMISLSSCGSTPRAATAGAQETAVTDEAPVVFTDAKLADAIIVGKVRGRHDQHGHLQAAATLENTTATAIVVGVRTVFRDSDGFSTGDETPWTRLVIGGGALENYQVRSLNDMAEDFQIEIRHTK